jgi:DNA helicase-2/ATP-dependent DNA helicase PcrA
MNKLDNEQQAAIGADINKKICVVAGAGSGKTTTLVARINHLIENGIDPKEIACITFTNSASQTIKKRVSGNLKFIGTLHSSMFGMLKAVNQELCILPDEESLIILHKYAKQLKLKRKSRKYLSSLRRNFWKDSIAIDSIALSLKKLKAMYLEHVFSMNALDYDTILMAGLDMLKNSISCSDIKYLFIDEYQDSSEIDLVIYDEICPQNQFAVGDPRQAIYGFRGDCSVDFLSINENFEEVYFLNNNYRSNDKIVSFANELQPEYQAMVSKCDKADGKSIHIASLESEADELHFLCNYLDMTADEVAILCRTNSQCRIIEDQLSAKGWRYDSNKTLIALADFWKIEYLLNLYENPRSKTASELYLRKLEPNKSDGYYLSSLDAMPLVKTDPSFSIVRFLFENGVSRLTLSELSGRIENFEEITDTLEFSQAINQAKNSASIINQGDIYPRFFVGTMHSAKSREWDSVIVPFCYEGNIPLANQDKEQERNLFYVACTRAKNKLIITNSSRIKPKYIQYNSVYKNSIDLEEVKTSSFINDIDKESIEIKFLHNS